MPSIKKKKRGPGSRGPNKPRNVPTIFCPDCGTACKGNVGYSSHVRFKHGRTVSPTLEGEHLCTKPVDRGATAEAKGNLAEMVGMFPVRLARAFQLQRGLVTSQATNHSSGIMKAFHPVYAKSAARAYIEGDLTGFKPFADIPVGMRAQLENLLSVLDVIDTIAHRRGFYQGRTEEFALKETPKEKEAREDMISPDDPVYKEAQEYVSYDVPTDRGAP